MLEIQLSGTVQEEEIEAYREIKRYAGKQVKFQQQTFTRHDDKFVRPVAVMIPLADAKFLFNLMDRILGERNEKRREQGYDVHDTEDRGRSGES